MKHLLNALSNSKLQVGLPEDDLKKLLSNVRDFRDKPPENNFYETLEKVLLELRTTEHASAFLKPVRKVDAPDYDLVIKHPMDLGTMLKKVKAHTYKSKKDFADDLTLIWDNCLTYNTDPAHPLRRATKFMRKKADHLLQRISDKNERVPSLLLTNLSLPSQMDVKMNGNGIQVQSPVSATGSREATQPPSRAPSLPRQRKKDVGFADRTPITRTQPSMARFQQLDAALDRYLANAGPSTLASNGLREQLQAVIKDNDGFELWDDIREESDDNDDDMEGVEVSGRKRDDVLAFVERTEGLKRKRSSATPSARKRIRTDLPDPLGGDDADPIQLWWKAARSNTLFGAAIPSMPRARGLGAGKRPLRTISKTKKKRKRSVKIDSTPPKQTLFDLIQGNIGTLRRVRHIHSKFLKLQRAQGEDGEPNEEPEEPIPELFEPKEELSWRRRAGLGLGRKVEIGAEQADDCLGWLSGKVLEHAGFEGSSKAALDILTSVTSEYLLNVGRTLRFMQDKYAKSMTPEELVLHALFESGVPEVQDLERYVKDDIIRYGGRLTELERKLDNAYREVADNEVIEDDALFEEDGDELVSGNFTSELGEDFFGFRELGLDKEFGLASLSVPRRLWTGKGRKTDAKDKDAAPKEPPLPYPPPPPFVPLDSRKVDQQIGLLKTFFAERFAALPAPPAPPPIAVSDFASVPPPAPAAHFQTLPDDAPPIMRTKIGPLGQITVPAASTMKKVKKKEREKEKEKEGEKDESKSKGKSKKKEENPPTGETLPNGDAAVDPTSPSKKKKGPKKGKKAAEVAGAAAASSMTPGVVVSASA